VCTHTTKLLDIFEYLHSIPNYHHLVNVSIVAHAPLTIRTTSVGLCCRPKGLTVLAALADVLDGLCFLHSAGWLHNDIRWDNIVMITEDNWCLIDFDFATRIDQPVIRTALGITKTIHLAPEVLQGEPFSTASDIFSVGSLVKKWLELFSGECSSGLIAYLNNLAELLTQGSPSQRPGAAYALQLVRKYRE
jgi:serine/threonine protein kinase